MPVIKIDCSAMEVEKKEQLIKSLTQTASSIMGIPEAAYVVLINEMCKDNIGVGERCCQRNSTEERLLSIYRKSRTSRKLRGVRFYHFRL